jgi:hypothetical protein
MSKLRWDENVVMDLEELRWEGVDWIHLAQEDRVRLQGLTNVVINRRIL